MKPRLQPPEALVPAPPIVAVGGVIYRYTRRNQVEILLIKKQDGFWTLPKGHVEYGESHGDAVCREMFEETGITVELNQRVSAVSYIILKRGMPHTKIVTYYLARAQSGRLRPDKQEHIVRIKWFGLESALRRIKRARVRAIVQRASTLLPPEGNPNQLDLEAPA